LPADDSDAVTVFRPIGPEEPNLIEQAGFRAFPPRLPEQPIFYPVPSEAYAAKIARDWNVPASGVGYVRGSMCGEIFFRGIKFKMPAVSAFRNTGFRWTTLPNSIETLSVR
jgi:hypothetical protein